MSFDGEYSETETEEDESEEEEETEEARKAKRKNRRRVEKGVLVMNVSGRSEYGLSCRHEIPGGEVRGEEDLQVEAFEGD